MDFDEIFRKVQPYANLERDIFGFLKKKFSAGFWEKKGKKWGEKSLFFSSVLSSSNFWCPEGYLYSDELRILRIKNISRLIIENS